MTESAPRLRARPPVVLLHGFTGSAESWLDVEGGLAERGCVAATLDLPGHGADAGRTDPAHFGLKAVLDRVGAAFEGPVDLVGYSMGGRIALHFAVAFPERVRRLVLESASPGLGSEEERRARIAADRRLAKRAVTEGIDAFVQTWESAPLFRTQSELPRAILDRQRARRLRNDVRSLAAALEGLGTGALPPLWSRLPRIAVPTLLIVGSEDPKFVEIARRMADQMPHAERVVVRGAGHCVHLERPSVWVDHVCTFLERPDPGA